VLVTDKLGSYQAARRSVLASVEHRQSKYLNNRAENSHQPTRVRERAMKKFSSPGGAQRFLAAFSVISPHFRTRRHLLHAQEYRPCTSASTSAIHAKCLTMDLEVSERGRVYLAWDNAD
jgi:putative transposase